MPARSRNPPTFTQRDQPCERPAAAAGQPRVCARVPARVSRGSPRLNRGRRIRRGRRGRRAVPRAPSRPLQPPAKVEVLGVHPLAFVEPARLIPRRAAYEQEGADRPRDIAGFRRIEPGAEAPPAGQAAADAEPAEQVRQSERERRERIHRLLGGAVGEDQAGRDRAGLGVPLGGGLQPRERARLQSDVRVGGRQPGRRRPSGDQVHARAEPEVLWRGDQLHPREALADHRGRAVRGGVIDHPYVGEPGARVLAQRGEAGR